MEQQVLARPALQSPAAPAPRFDIYTGIHKALRALMSDTLCNVGRMDAADDVETAGVLGQTRLLLEVCTMHLEKENEFLHPAIEARRPGAAARTADEHLGHEQSIREIGAAIDAVEAAPAGSRAAAALRLYRQLALFVAENFEHMNVEETANHAALWETHTDAELHAIHAALLASVKPLDMALILRWMIPSVSHAERVEILGGIRHGAPAQVFQGVLASARAHLPARDWDKLAVALGD